MHETPWTPGRLLETSSNYWTACALHAGLKLGIFTAIGAGNDRLDTLLSVTGCDRRGLSMLLDALTALGLLRKSGESYANTTIAAERLDHRSPEYMGHILLHHHHLMAGWAQLPQAVRTGLPLRTSASHTDAAEERESFLMGMFNMASLVAPQMAHQLDLSGCKRLLDFGGGPGTYAIHFCLTQPALQAVVFDLPTTRPFAETTIARFGLQERISFCPGSYPDDPLPGTFDVAWLSHVLHGEGPETCVAMLKQALSALEPGGKLLIHEFILDDDRSGPAFPALFALNMLINTEAGRSYTNADLTEMLHRAGARQVERLQLDLSGPSGVIAAIR